MRTIVAAVLLAASVAMSCRRTSSEAPVSPADRIAIEQAVSAAHDRSLAAAEALDLDRLFGFLAENDRGAMIGNGRLLLTRAEVVAANRRQFQNIAALKYEVRERHVTVLSRMAALLVATGQTQVTTTDGRVATAPYAQSMVWVLRDGRWQVLHLHSSAPAAR